MQNTDSYLKLLDKHDVLFIGQSIADLQLSGKELFLTDKLLINFTYPLPTFKRLNGHTKDTSLQYRAEDSLKNTPDQNI